MTVVNGVSSYNKKSWEKFSSAALLRGRMFRKIQSDHPDAGALLENIEIDLSHMPAALREHAMWKLHRAILACLPGMRFIE